MTDWMTLLESVRTWWQRVTPASERPPAVFPIERSTPRVPAEYVSLYTYLEHRYASVVVLTFEQMEALLGFALPASAGTEREWWTGRGRPIRIVTASSVDGSGANRNTESLRPDRHVRAAA